MIIDKLFIPKYCYYGIKSKKGSCARMKIFGADIETVKGEPKLLTITHELKKEAVTVYHVSKNNIMMKFLKHLYDNALKGQVNLCFFHNLNHDLVALFYKDYTVLRNSTFVIQYGDEIKLEVFAGNTWFANVTFNDKTKVYILDSFRYVFTSLAKISEQLNFKFQKKGKPKFLGEKITPEIIEYAKYDTLAELELAQWIMANHREYNVNHSVSLANLASEIFKHKFIPKGKIISLPSSVARNYAIRAYHGGRNGLYIDKLPRIIKNVTELDIISSYPNAMVNMPNFLEGKYKNTDKFDKKYIGVYRLIADIASVKYPICFNDDFKPFENGAIEQIIYLTSFDIKQALKTKEIKKIHTIKGVIFIPSEPKETNPLRNYALHFFEKKNTTPKTDSRYFIFKLLLNALYGKFFQRTEIVNYSLVDGKYVRESWYKAGGLFNPFIASMITSYARVELNKLEWKYKSIHSSTDSIKTTQKINEKTLPKGLGGLTKEINGDCLIFRNKLYIHFNNSVHTTNSIIKRIRKGTAKKEDTKIAMHGFQGTIKDLIRMYETGNRKYQCVTMTKVREAIRSKGKKKALLFVEQERNLKV
jgi:hypothetical protein